MPPSEPDYTPTTPPDRSSDALGPAVEIVSAGNEVLLGDVLDTNTNWLCKRVTGLGGHVRRTVMLRDEVATIADELRGAIARRPALVLTVGGLGPTTDDLTLLGVASALGVPVELHADAERMVRERYEEFAARQHVPFAGMNEARRKMARLPRGATPLLNPVGGAPGVLTELDADRLRRLDKLEREAGRRPREASSADPSFGPPVVTIVSLPGVPAELKAIVDGSLTAVFERVFGEARFEERVLIVHTQDESAIAHVLAAVERSHPDVYIKSRAQRIGSDRVNRITASARGRDEATVGALLDPVVRELQGGIEAAGFATEPGEPED